MYILVYDDNMFLDIAIEMYLYEYYSRLIQFMNIEFIELSILNYNNKYVIDISYHYVIVISFYVNTS